MKLIRTIINNKPISTSPYRTRSYFIMDIGVYTFSPVLRKLKRSNLIIDELIIEMEHKVYRDLNQGEIFYEID